MSFAGGREKRKYGAASSRESLIDAINNRELGEAVNYDDKDEFSSRTTYIVYKTYYKRLKHIIPDIQKRMNELEEKSLRLARTTRFYVEYALGTPARVQSMVSQRTGYHHQRLSPLCDETNDSSTAFVS